MQCEYCGQSYSETDGDLCPGCGAKLPVAGTTAAANTAGNTPPKHTAGMQLPPQQEQTPKAEFRIGIGYIAWWAFCALGVFSAFPNISIMLTAFLLFFCSTVMLRRKWERYNGQNTLLTHTKLPGILWALFCVTGMVVMLSLYRWEGIIIYIALSLIGIVPAIVRKNRQNNH